MVDEKKVALMTKLAIYEKHEDSRNIVVSKYYESDYVRYNVLKSLVAATVVYWTIVGGILFMKFDTVLAKINDIDYFGAMYKLLGGYVVVCLIYFAISSILYRYRYMVAKPGLFKYNSNLKDLIELEGGPAHKAHVRRNADISNVQPEVQKSAKNDRGNVSRMAMIRQREEEVQDIKNQQILDNVKKREERLALQNAERDRQQRLREQEQKRIMERRKALERQQVEQLRNERMKEMTRQDYQYRQNNNEGGTR